MSPPTPRRPKATKALGGSTADGAALGSGLLMPKAPPRPPLGVCVSPHPGLLTGKATGPPSPGDSSTRWPPGQGLGCFLVSLAP